MRCSSFRMRDSTCWRTSPHRVFCRGSHERPPEETLTMKRWIAAMIATVAAFGLVTADAQDKKVRLSIGTGGAGGVYYPLGGGLAAMISKYVPGVEATAEVTAGSIANLQLIGSGKSEIAFTMADAA